MSPVIIWNIIGDIMDEFRPHYLCFAVELIIEVAGSCMQVRMSSAYNPICIYVGIKIIALAQIFLLKHDRYFG